MRKGASETAGTGETEGEGERKWPLPTRTARAEGDGLMEIPLTLASKLGSIAVYIDEYCGEGGLDVDLILAWELAKDPEVTAWLKENRALMPVKR